MIDTLRPLASDLAVEVEARAAFAESRAEWVDDAGAFRRTVGRFLSDPDAPPADGWETAVDAAARFIAGVEEALEQASGALVVCSGGRVLTAVLCRLGFLEPADALEAWAALRMPDVAVLRRSARGWRMVSEFGSSPV